nr:Chain C, GP41 PEPTIDE [Human immunodeficiency virus 1]
ELDHWAS